MTKNKISFVLVYILSFLLFVLSLPTFVFADNRLSNQEPVFQRPTNTPRPTNTRLPTRTPFMTNTPIPTSTSTPIPTDTPVPTDTPLPTDTPISTNTAVPTHTSSPTATHTNTPAPTVDGAPVGGTDTPTAVSPSATLTPVPTETAVAGAPVQPPSDPAPINNAPADPELESAQAEATPDSIPSLGSGPRITSTGFLAAWSIIFILLMTSLYTLWKPNT